MASQVLLNSLRPSLDVLNSSVNELFKSGTLSSLPPAYTLKGSLATDLQNVVEDVEIPVIDFSMLTEGTPEQRSQVVRDLGKACEEWGFFVLVNHDVPDKLREAIMHVLKMFFNLPVEDKEEYSDTHTFKPIRYGTSINPKVDEVRYWRDYLKVITHPEFDCPTKPPEFREVLQEYVVCMRAVGRRLLGGIWESLGLNEKYMSEALDFERSFEIFICNLYPPCPQPDLAIGLPPHSDHGLLTILYQNDVDGLELKHNNKWVRVKPLPNSYLVNTGDLMEIVSNGKYKSLLHRVVVNGKSTRMSMVTIASPSLDTIVSPVPQLVSSNTPVAFRGMKYGEFMEYQQSTTLKEKSVLDLLRI